MDVIDTVLLFQDENNDMLFVRHSGKYILDTGPGDAWDSVHVSDPGVLFGANEYKMWYTGDDGTHNRIGYATSDEGVEWKKYPGNPVLDVGQPGEWDSVYVSMSCVISDGAGYKMWYTGIGEHKNFVPQRIGYATSVDGIEWKKYPGNPVLDVGQPGAWDSIYVYKPHVIFDGEKYRMWYAGAGEYRVHARQRIGYATSVDGITWEKYAGNPVLDVGQPGAWDSGSVFKPNVIFNGTQHEMWYVGHEAMNSRLYRIGCASSPDGIVWHKHPGNPVLDVGSTEWDSERVGGPSVIFDGDQYRVWYHGFDGARWRIGYAANGGR